jgi:hypothetical protein
VPALGRTPLRVQALPGAVVTFHSNGLGLFPNQLTTIVVAADAQGFASTVWWADPGCRGEAAVSAASPACAGIVQWSLFVNESSERLP